MKIELKPEIEALIKQDVERGRYKSVDEFVGQAVSLLHEQEVPGGAGQRNSSQD